MQGSVIKTKSGKIKVAIFTNSRTLYGDDLIDDLNSQHLGLGIGLNVGDRYDVGIRNGQLLLETPDDRCGSSSYQSGAKTFHTKFYGTGTLKKIRTTENRAYLYFN